MDNLPLCHFHHSSLSFRVKREILVPSGGRDLKDSSSLSLLGMTQNGEIQSSHEEEKMRRGCTKLSRKLKFTATIFFRSLNILRVRSHTFVRMGDV